MIRKTGIIAFLVLNSILIVAQKRATRIEYINQYNTIAMQEMKRAGIPASITLAQGILESDNGNSTLAVKANNHFGIKCHSGWKGKTYTHDDDRPNECFRKYLNAEESFRDHSNFLTEQQRYAFLFEFETTDYKNWAKGLKRAGYATNREYDNLLIKIIEENELHKFDGNDYKANRTQLADNIDNLTINPFDDGIRTYNRINYVVVKEGDTFESIAKKYDVRTWQLYKYNELPADAELIPGYKLYLQPKRRKAEVGNNYHTIVPGENMYIISQNYGVKMKHLYRINNFESNKEPEIGYTISLRKRKK